jgi:hypothetical protein
MCKVGGPLGGAVGLGRVAVAVTGTEVLDGALAGAGVGRSEPMLAQPARRDIKIAIVRNFRMVLY